jgi:Arc/MetJ-type ribon-helix-helix transcriptional regulator
MISKKRGPKPKGAVAIMVRVPPEQVDRLDTWVARQSDLPSRPEAIRRLIELGLAAKTKKFTRVK